MFIQTDWTENLVQVVWYGDMKPLSNHDDIRNMGSMMFSLNLLTGTDAQS